MSYDVANLEKDYDKDLDIDDYQERLAVDNGVISNADVIESIIKESYKLGSKSNIPSLSGIIEDITFYNEDIIFTETQRRIEQCDCSCCMTNSEIKDKEILMENGYCDQCYVDVEECLYYECGYHVVYDKYSSVSNTLEYLIKNNTVSTFIAAKENLLFSYDKMLSILKHGDEYEISYSLEELFDELEYQIYPYNLGDNKSTIILNDCQQVLYPSLLGKNSVAKSNGNYLGLNIEKELNLESIKLLS